MKRIAIALSLLALVVSIGQSTAFAGGAASAEPASKYLAKQWLTWVFGSDAAPIITGACGEQVGDRRFFLTAAFNPGRTTIECEVPHGAPIVASPGGTLFWAPTSGNTAQELLDAVTDDLATISDVKAKLDGENVDLSEAFLPPDVFRMALEPGNLIQTVDSDVKGDSARVAWAGWFLKISCLSRGNHILVLSDEINGQLFKVRFELMVV